MEITTQLIFVFLSIVFTEQHHFFVPIVGEGSGFPGMVVYHGHNHFFGHERLFHPGFPVVVNPALADLRAIAPLPVVNPSEAKLVAPAFGAYFPTELAKSSGKPIQAVSLFGEDKRPTAITKTTDFAVEKSVIPKPDIAAKVGSSKL